MVRYLVCSFVCYVHPLLSARAHYYTPTCLVVCRYIDVLLDLARLPAMQQGRAISAQLLDVAVRVPTIRAYCVKKMVRCHTVNLCIMIS